MRLTNLFESLQEEPPERFLAGTGTQTVFNTLMWREEYGGAEPMIVVKARAQPYKMFWVLEFPLISGIGERETPDFTKVRRIGDFENEKHADVLYNSTPDHSFDTRMTAALTQEYTDWGEATGIQDLRSAEELDTTSLSDGQKYWLERFINRWNKWQDIEDNRSWEWLSVEPLD